MSGKQRVAMIAGCVVLALGAVLSGSEEEIQTYVLLACAAFLAALNFAGRGRA